CTGLQPPRYGLFYVEKGSGISVGSMVVFWCKDGYQLVGSETLACLHGDSAPQWSSQPPLCEAIPKPVDKGFRVAVIASIISCIIILSMSISFVVCCVQEQLEKRRERLQETRN
uniref:Sushi domain-containing protein n=2 Tax=Latimeria chalumnae TaxID=7897 RepID=H2ZWT6_LATCH